MEASIVNSSFDTTKLQLHVFQFLNAKDLKSTRLVCPHWFRTLGLICSPGFKLDNNNSENLQMLKKSFHPVIEFLHVSNYTEILPIYTSTRFEIPKAKYVVLDSGNSVENVMKLLRNYAKLCDGLVILPNSFEKVAPFRLKGLAYESLYSLNLTFERPSNDLQDSGKRNHLITLTQFLKTTKFPNLRSFSVICPRWLSNIYPFVLKFHQAMNSFFERHGQQLTELRYQRILPLVVTNSFKHLSTLEKFYIEFNEELFHQPEYTNDIREALKHIKKLKCLECSDYGVTFLGLQFQLRSEYMRSMVKENRKFINKFCFESFYTRTDWIPEVEFAELKEIQLRFSLFDQNAFLNVHQELRSVSKLHFYIECTDGDSENWMAQISPWIAGTFPNLTDITLDCVAICLKLSDCDLIISNLVHLKKFITKCVMTEEARNWFTWNNYTKFIKSTPIEGGLEIVIRRPLPSNIFN